MALPAADAAPTGGIVDLLEAWRVLRTHLEFTEGLPSVVFVCADDLRGLASLGERADLLCRMRGVEVRHVGLAADTDFRSLVRDLLPAAGLLWIQLDDATVSGPGRTVWRAALHTLNELRTPLNQGFAGTVVLAGPTWLPQLASAEAADLWSVRSWVRRVGTTAAPASVPALHEASTENQAPFRFTFPTFELRPAHDSAVSDGVRRLLRAAAGDAVSGHLVAAQQGAMTAWELVRSAKGADPDVLAVARLAAAETSLAVGDLATAHLVLGRLDDESVDSRIRLALLDLRGALAISLGRWDEAGQAYDAALAISRESAVSMATSESRRDLSVSLDLVGRVRASAGDWSGAEAAYVESLGICRGLVESVGTPESRRDLSVSLDLVGRVRASAGDRSGALTAFREAHALAESLAELLGTPQAAADLEVTQRAVARVQSTPAGGPAA